MFWFWCQTGVGVQLNTKTQIQDQRSSTIQPLIILASSPERKKHVSASGSITRRQIMLLSLFCTVIQLLSQVKCIMFDCLIQVMRDLDHMVGLQESCPHKKRSVLVWYYEPDPERKTLPACIYYLYLWQLLPCLHSCGAKWCPKYFGMKFQSRIVWKIPQVAAKADKLGLCSDLQEAFQATVIFGERVSMQSWSTTIAVLEVVFALGFCLVMLQLKAETSANIYVGIYIYTHIGW